MQSHGYETRAVCAVVSTLRIGILLIHRVGDVLGYPILATVHNLLAGDLAAYRGTSAAAAAAAALAGDHAVGASLDVVVGDVAPVLGFVPEVITRDILSGNLTTDLDVIALVICLDDLVMGGRARAAVDSGARDWICADHGKGREKGDGQEFELHDGFEVGRVIRWVFFCSSVVVLRDILVVMYKMRRFG